MTQKTPAKARDVQEILDEARSKLAPQEPQEDEAQLINPLLLAA